MADKTTPMMKQYLRLKASGQRRAPAFAAGYALQCIGQCLLQATAIGSERFGHRRIARTLGQHLDAEQCPFRLPAQRVEVVQEGQHLRAFAVGCGQPLQQRRQFLAFGHGHRKDDRLLAREVVVEIAQADAGRLRYIAHAGQVEALVQETLQGRLQDLRAALLIAVGSVHDADSERTFVHF